VLGQTALPRHSSLIIRGESLLNDATALLIFGAAVPIAAQAPTSGNLAHIGLAVPGGILFGIVMGLFFVYIARFFAGTQSSIIISIYRHLWMLAVGGALATLAGSGRGRRRHDRRVFHAQQNLGA
jgi:CPA1 family monovalent cation:H+ antiporter